MLGHFLRTSSTLQKIKIDLNRTRDPHGIHALFEEEFTLRSGLNDIEVCAFANDTRAEFADCLVGR